MARRYVKIYINNYEVRTYGGNGSDVRNEYNKYLNMTKEEFISRHPRWKTEVEQNGYRLLAVCPDWPVNTATMNKYWEGEDN